MKNICEYSNYELFCNLGLYQEISVDCTDFIYDSHQEYVNNYGCEYYITIHEIKYSEQFNRLISFMLDTQNTYIYCPLCNKHMSFQLFPVKLSAEFKNTLIESYSDDSIDADYVTSEDIKMSAKINKIAFENKLFEKIIRCTHDNSHEYKFYYLIKKKGESPKEFITLTKIGQYPSINDFSIENIKSYQKLLKDYKNEYTKALGLYSAGIGIGSFVYLRRILEFLLENAFQKANAEGIISKEEYMKDGKRNRKIDEKIKILKDYLPEFMVENSTIYNIISKGIHELDEETCKEIFPVLQKSIELILDEEIAIQHKDKITKSARSELGRIKSKLS